MGYRSEAILAVSDEIMPHLLGHLSQCDERAHQFVFFESDKKVKEHEGEDFPLFRRQDVKWYETYPEVKAVNDFVSRETSFLQEVEYIDDWDAHIRFIRIGEDYDDVVVEGYFCDHLIMVHRSIYTDFEDEFDLSL